MDGPAPGKQPLELIMECFNGSTSAGGSKHGVTVNSDWSVTTPHDPDAERIAEAFGSSTSCVTHMARVVEAFRKSLGLLARSERVPLRVGRGGRWQVGKGHAIVGCCRGASFGGVVAAARHTRAPMHLAKQHDVPLEYLESFLSAAATTWGDWDGTPEVDPHIESLIRDPGGVGVLWRAGIHPAEIPMLAAVGSVVDEPLPVNFYLGLVYGSADARWVAEVLAHRPDPDTAAWLAWLDQPQRGADAADWGSWISFGISRGDVVVAVQAGIAAEHVLDVAVSHGWPVREVASQFVTWARAGCTVTSEHFEALKRNGIDASRPSQPAIDALCEQFDRDLRSSVSGSLGDRPDRTDLAVMLEILGNRNEALRALNLGNRTPDDLDTYVRSYEQVRR